MRLFFFALIFVGVYSHAAELKPLSGLKSNGVQGGGVPCSPDTGKNSLTGCICVGDNCNQTPLDAALGRNTKPPENQSPLPQNATGE